MASLQKFMIALDEESYKAHGETIVSEIEESSSRFIAIAVPDSEAVEFWADLDSALRMAQMFASAYYEDLGLEVFNAYEDEWETVI